MIVADVEHIMEEWAPRWTAWERDNVGLQIGDRRRKVRRILVSLDVTREIAREAIRKRIDLIISHHPLLFRPPSSLRSSERIGEIVLLLAKNNIAVYSSHTNLDFTREGVSFTLARTLGIREPRFLSPLKDHLAKIVVFVPEPYVNEVMQSMAEAGAGVIGDYSMCSFQAKGRGTFRGSQHSRPFVGKAGVLESAEEVRLEMVLPRALSNDVLHAMRRVHPYQEVAYDLYPVQNESSNYGMGAVGDLKSPMTLSSFLRKAKVMLKADALRYSGDLKQRIRRVAVCGGSGSDLLDDAVRDQADVFLTADIRYHTYHDAEHRIALVDAGHWETEHVILPVIRHRLQQSFVQAGESVSVSVTKDRTSPLQSYW